MGNQPIDSLHLGMNLRDPAAAVAPGETGEALGIDFGVPGELKPMRAPLLTWTLAATIIDAHIVYLGGVQYLFTTHADGLRVTHGVTTTLIDAAFIGTFKILPINDEYVNMSSLALCRTWVPGEASTVQWGLNTPNNPTLEAGNIASMSIDDCDDITGWVKSGGGASGAMVIDTGTFLEGAGSLKLSCDKNYTLYAAKPLSLDLSKYVTAGDAETNCYISFAFFTNNLAAVDSVGLRLSVAEDGGYEVDYFTINIDLSSVQTQGTLVFEGGSYGALAPLIQSVPSDFSQSVTSGAISKTGSPQGDVLGIWSRDEDVLLANAGTDYSVSRAKKQQEVGTGGWYTIKVLKSEFTRVGIAAGRGWNTITGIRIRLTAVSSLQAIAYFDDIKMEGQNLWGDYWVAVAYENAQGNYGPYSEFVGPVHLEGQPLVVGNLIPDTDPQTIKRRLAVLGGFLTTPMVTWLEDNVSRALVYNTSDADLVTEETNFNNRKPSPCRDMKEIMGRIMMVGVTGFKNCLIYSEPEFYAGFPYKNYRTIAEDEDLYQVAQVSQAVAMRGKNREHFLQLNDPADPITWTPYEGVTKGAISSRLLLEMDGGQIFASDKGLYHSPGDAYYLPKINPKIYDPAAMFGAQVSKLAYLYFKDTDGVDRVMRLDYRLQQTIAHYVANLAPAAIFADKVLDKVFYALGDKIYEFDGGTLPMATKLVIPEQLCGFTGFKDFGSLLYALSGGALAMAFTVDGQAVAGSYTLPVATRNTVPASIPAGTVGTQLGITLTSTTEDWILYLPLGILFGETA